MRRWGTTMASKGVKVNLAKRRRGRPGFTAAARAAKARAVEERTIRKAYWAHVMAVFCRLLRPAG